MSTQAHTHMLFMLCTPHTLMHIAHKSRKLVNITTQNIYAKNSTQPDYPYVPLHSPCVWTKCYAILWPADGTIVLEMLLAPEITLPLGKRYKNP